MTDAADKPVETPEPPKKRGKPKGLPKSGGRKKGDLNKVNAELRQYLALQSKPLVKFLVNVALAHKIKVPSATDPRKTERRVAPPELQVAAAKILAAKFLPDMRATEITGDGDKPTFHIIRSIVDSPKSEKNAPEPAQPATPTQPEGTDTAPKADSNGKPIPKRSQYRPHPWHRPH